MIPAAPVDGYRPVRRIDQFFEVNEFQRDVDGFNITIANNSKRGFSDFQIVVLGLDIGGVHVYRREINVDNFMEGQSERTFFLPGYDSRVFRVKLRVFDIIPLQDEYYE